MGAEQQHVDQAGDHRRDRERQVDEGDQQALAEEVELGDRPGGGEPEDQVERHGDRRHGHGQPDGGERVTVDDRRQIGTDSLAQRLDEHGGQRQHQEQADEAQGQRDHQPAHPALLGQRRAAALRRRALGGERR